MLGLEWVVVGLIVGISAFYSIRRLLPRRRRDDSGCGSCPAHEKHTSKQIR